MHKTLALISDNKILRQLYFAVSEKKREAFLNIERSSENVNDNTNTKYTYRLLQTYGLQYVHAVIVVVVGRFSHTIH